MLEVRVLCEREFEQLLGLGVHRHQPGGFGRLGRGVAQDRVLQCIDHLTDQSLRGVEDDVMAELVGLDVSLTPEASPVRLSDGIFRSRGVRDLGPLRRRRLQSSISHDASEMSTELSRPSG